MPDPLPADVLASLLPDKFGWWAELPLAAGDFLGTPMRINVQTRPIPEAGAPPRPNEAELQLVRIVLEGWRPVLLRAETEFRAYNAPHDPNAENIIREPHVWIDRECMTEEGQSRWTLVVGRRDAPDFGYHLEFEGTEFLEIWAGD